jgi:hypothetical protein
MWTERHRINFEIGTDRAFNTPAGVEREGIFWLVALFPITFERLDKGFIVSVILDRRRPVRFLDYLKGS